MLKLRTVYLYNLHNPLGDEYEKGDAQGLIESEKFKPTISKANKRQQQILVKFPL